MIQNESEKWELSELIINDRCTYYNEQVKRPTPGQNYHRHCDILHVVFRRDKNNETEARNKKRHKTCGISVRAILYLALNWRLVYLLSCNREFDSQGKKIEVCGVV